MSCSSVINHYCYVMSHVSSVVAYWPRTYGVAGSNPIEVCLFSFMQQLFYTKQRITAPKFCIFRKSFTITHCMALLEVALVSIPPHKFVRLPCWYYRL
jgi:hypothetical protein